MHRLVFEFNILKIIKICHMKTSRSLNKQDMVSKRLITHKIYYEDLKELLDFFYDINSVIF